MARVIVSAGHTSNDPGSVASGIREVDLTRSIAKETTKKLREYNIITLSVPPDLDLARRIEWINQTGYSEANNDIAIEIHINEGGKSGIEGWHQADKPNSIQLTETIVNEVCNALNWKSQGIRSEYDHEYGSLALLHNTNPIASLIETGYIDNENDMKILKSKEGIEKLAQAIADGIAMFMGIKVKSAEKKEPDTKSDKKKEHVQDDKQPVNTDNGNTDQVKPVNPPAQQPQQMDQPAVQSSNFPQNSFNSFNNMPVTSPSLNTQPPSSFPNSNPMGSFGGFNSSSMSGGFQNPASGGAYMSRDDRNEMIRKNYIKILGREPSQADLNYFLNIGTTEDQLIKKMVDSQEHADLVKARQEVIKTKEQLVGQTDELMRLRAKTNDQKGIIRNLNYLLMQKNRAIQQLQYKLSSMARPKVLPANKPQYQKTSKERFLDYFSSKLG